MYKPQSNAAGFSMVEVVVAMLLLGVMAVSILPLMLTITQGTLKNQQHLAATQLARAKIIEAQSYSPPREGYAVSCAALRAKLEGLHGVDPHTGFHYRYMVAEGWVGEFGMFGPINLHPLREVVAPPDHCQQVAIKTLPSYIGVYVYISKDGRVLSRLATALRVSQP